MCWLETEELAVFRDVDRSELTGPRIDILKNVEVDGLKMPCIETTVQGLVLKLTDAAAGCFRFELS